MSESAVRRLWQRTVHSPWSFAAILLLALAVRLAYLAQMRGTPLFSILVLDGQIYDEWARRIAAGDWYGSEVFYQAPLYPYALALLYSLAGPDVWTARLAQALIGSASCALLALAGRRFFSPSVGVVAGVVMALYGPLVFFDGLIQKPVLDVFLTCLLLLLLGEMARRQRWWLMLAAGAVLGLFALTRENALVLAPILLAWTLLRFRAAGGRARLRWAAALAAGLALVLVPVGLRNRDIGGDFLITTAQLGTNLFIGNNPLADGTYRALRPGREHPKFERVDAVALAQERLGRALSLGEVSDYWTRRALEYVRESPGAWLRLMGRKWVMVWNARELVDTESVEAYREWSAVLGALTAALHFGVIGPLALAGAWVTRRRWRELWLLHAIVLGFAASVTVFYVLARYRTPMIPVLMLYAAAGLVQLVSAPRATRWGYVGCLLLGAAAMNWPLPSPWDPRAITYQNVGIDLVKDARESARRQQTERAAREFRQSQELFLRVLRLVPPTSYPAAETHKLLALAYDLGGQPDLAIEHYRRASALLPRDPQVQEYLGDLLAVKGRIAEAAEHWQAAALLSPNDPGLRGKLAGAQAARGGGRGEGPRQ